MYKLQGSALYRKDAFYLLEEPNKFADKNIKNNH